jgi:hypothetical protein
MMSDDRFSAPQSTNGRTCDGRFARNNSLAKGNPAFRRMQELRKSLLEAADPATLQNLFRKLADLGMEGDTAAARLYIEHCVGKPVQALSLTGPDGEPLGGDLATLRTVIMSALDRHPAAKIEVAAALMRLRYTDGPDTGTGE